MPFTLLPLTPQLYGPQTYLYEPKDLYVFALTRLPMKYTNTTQHHAKSCASISNTCWL
jgi:hypothetical protein